MTRYTQIKWVRHRAWAHVEHYLDALMVTDGGANCAVRREVAYGRASAALEILLLLDAPSQRHVYVTYPVSIYTVPTYGIPLAGEK
jgi:hypothetical protein